MPSRKKRLIAYTAFAALASLGLAVFRVVLLYLFYDPYSGEYASEASTALSVFGYILLGVIVLLATVIFSLRGAGFSAVSASGNQFSVFSGALCSFLCFAADILLAVYYAKDVLAESTHSAYKLLLLAAFFVLLPTAAYFLVSASSRRAPDDKTRKLLSFFPPLWALLYLVASYINPSYLYQDFNRILCNVSLIALLLFFLMETRSTVAEPLNGFRFAFSLIALVCTVSYVVPLLLVTAFWEVELTHNTVFELVECGAIFHIAATLRNLIDALQTQTQE